MATKPTIDLRAQPTEAVSKPDSITLSAALNQTGSAQVQQLLPKTPSRLSSDFVRPHGILGSSITAYPNDVIRLDIFNANGDYLESNYRIQTAQRSSDVVTVSPEQDLSSLGYIAGRYRVEYKFHRNILGSGDYHKLQIQEISSNGLEIRVLPSLLSNVSNTEFVGFFGKRFFETPKAEFLTNLFLFKDAQTAIQVFDYVQDKFTFSVFPHSIIFKLRSAIPDTIVVGDTLWLAQEVSAPVIDNIVISPPKPKSKKTFIAGPNWDVLSKQQTSVATQYKDWDDLLGSDTQTSQDIINKVLSGSLLEGVNLNIDFKKFENFVHFGTATERLHNFKYKMRLLEVYNARINELTTDLSGLPSSSVSQSLYFQRNVTDTKTKRANLLGSFDAYEKYLYYESSSYVTNSFGEFYPTTWPKSNSTYPYVNYSFSSSQADDWFTGVISSASLYDQNNANALYKTIPEHILNDDANDQYLLFVNMIGHYFDLMFAYIKQTTEIYNRNQSIWEGFSKELIYHLAKNLGIDFENSTTIDELWKYTLGVDESGSLISNYGITTEDKTKEIWKRILNNLPYLLKTKGTERGIRALINCFGIPQTILRIREYGGAEPDFNSKTDSVYERFFYALNVGYNGITGSNAANLVQAPWQKLTANNQMPLTIELRAQMLVSQSLDQTIFEVPNKWKVRAFQSASGTYVGFFLSGSQGWATASVTSSIYDGTYHHISLRRENETDVVTDNQTYTLSVRKVNYLKIVAANTASMTIDGATSSSYNTTFLATGSIWIPGSGSFTGTNSASFGILSGSVQEFRYWSTTLQDAILDNHALAPTSFQGNTDEISTGSTSSFYDLGFRLCLGSDNKERNVYSTSSLSSQHPNQAEMYFSGSIYKSASFYNFVSASDPSNYYTPVTEIHSLEWPDLGGNRSVSTKIRIDSTITAGTGTQLYKDNSVQRSLSDSQPPDSSRLGVYLSPVNEVNQDIAEQFGGLSIDDFIGSPSDLQLDTYPDLEGLTREYLKKYNGTNKAQNYIRLLQYYDAALFKLIKKFVPFRANTQTGLVIEPHLLSRSKISTKLPTFNQNQYSASIDVGPETYITPGGFVEDGDGEPFRNMPGYVEGGTIGGDESDYITLTGAQQPVPDYYSSVPHPERSAYKAPLEGINMLVDLPTQDYDMVVVDGITLQPNPTLFGQQNPYNLTGEDELPSQTGSLTGRIDFGISSYGRDTRVQGSQYIFYSYAQSSSYTNYESFYDSGYYDTSSYAAAEPVYVVSEIYGITSSRYDYHEPTGPVIYDSAYSEIANRADSIYDTDVYNKKAFTNTSTYASGAASNYKTLYTSSGANYENRWTNDYGLRISSYYVNNVEQSSPYNSSAYWGLTGSLGLYFYTATQLTSLTGSVKLPAFFYKENDPKTHTYVYKITIYANETQGGTDKLELHYGDLNCGVSQSISLAATQSLTVQPIGPWLGIKVYNYLGLMVASNATYIQSLKVECINYRSQTQDFHLQNSRGMVNARYEGSKLTSTDWNEDSNDTIDKGPVVVIVTGKGNQMVVNPNPRGAQGVFEVL